MAALIVGSKHMSTESVTHPWGIKALSIFFLAGAAVSLTAGISLLFPNRLLDSMWRLNPRAHENLSSFGLWAAVLLTTVSVLCAAAAIGLWRGSRWGYWIAIGLIAMNLVGDVTNVFLGTEPRAIIGVPVAAAILAYLISRRVREFFSRSSGLK
jgi:uncharacterized membrane protein (DUF2068 family)